MIIPTRRSSLLSSFTFFFFFHDTATTEIYTLSLHDALPIYPHLAATGHCCVLRGTAAPGRRLGGRGRQRSEEHTSELQSHSDLVCRLLLEKKKKQKITIKKTTQRKTGTLAHAQCMTITLQDD